MRPAAGPVQRHDKTEFLDQRQLHGHAFVLLDEAVHFIMRHIPVAGRIEPGATERQDTPLYPPLALREALVNALCHRDYTIPGGAMNVAIFDDRLEIVQCRVGPGHHGGRPEASTFPPPAIR